MQPFHAIGDLVRQLLLGIPLEVARGLFATLLVGVMIWVLRLPNSRTTPPDSPHWYNNLKLWAVLALGIQLAIYLYF